jgi:hypothetical protein
VKTTRTLKFKLTASTTESIAGRDSAYKSYAAEGTLEHDGDDGLTAEQVVRMAHIEALAKGDDDDGPINSLADAVRKTASAIGEALGNVKGGDCGCGEVPKDAATSGADAKGDAFRVYLDTLATAVRDRSTPPRPPQDMIEPLAEWLGWKTQGPKG